MVMVGRVGGSSSGSRAETFALIEDLLDLAYSIDSKIMKSNAEITKFMSEIPLVDYLDLQIRDIQALYNLAKTDLPLIIESNRASDILKLIEIKKNII